jgi:type IV pilus assembly protein PilW
MSLRRSMGPIRAAGFTLVEIMIALLIGLIGIVVMMQTFAVSEGFKRTATSGTDAQINGGVGLYMLQRELRMSGYGLNAMMLAGCPSVRVWNNAAGTGMDMPIVPFMINPAGVPAGDANTDVLLIAYGTSDSAVSGIGLTMGQVSGPNDPLNLSSNWDAFQTGDLFVTVQPNGATPSCVLHEATLTTNPATNCGSSNASPLVTFGTTTYQQHTPAGCVTTTPRYNRASAITDSSGTAVPSLTYPGGTVYNLGNLAVHVYAVRNGALTMCDWMAANCTAAAGFTPIVDDIVSLRAVYGMNLTPAVNAAVGDGVIAWNRNDLTTNVYLPSRVMAVTMAVVARSGLKEKVNQAGVCATTPSATRPDVVQDWIYQSMAGAAINVSATSTDWACYRYKLFQTSVPMRNTIWRPD